PKRYFIKDVLPERSAKEGRCRCVIISFFRGSYLIGSPSLPEYNGSALADKTGSIAVNINYRTRVFGFGRLRREKMAPGNMVLLDQQIALKWIHENIGKFGGKNDMITLLGHTQKIKRTNFDNSIYNAKKCPTILKN
uniref:COesterase domain-containing protein n=1 Tax=Strongyloides papillosus TaxID=174720 RepID=A0A0N5B5E0_STREA